MAARRAKITPRACHNNACQKTLWPRGSRACMPTVGPVSRARTLQRTERSAAGNLSLCVPRRAKTRYIKFQLPRQRDRHVVDTQPRLACVPVDT